MITRRVLLSAASLIAGLGAMRRSEADDGAPAKALAEVGKPAPPFAVADALQHRRTLAEFAGKPVVLEWTSATCPYAAAQYQSGRMPALQKWAEGRGVVWLSVISTHPSRPDYLGAVEADRFNRTRGGVPTALLMDREGVIGHAYGAMTADHMFVIDGAGILVYAGGIDDARSTHVKEVLRAHNLVRAALEDVLAGKKVKTSTSEPAGCAISYQG